jgi:uncharacterized protein (DUF2147 family)
VRRDYLGQTEICREEIGYFFCFKNLDIGDILSSTKPPAKEHGKSPATADRPKLAEPPTADQSNRDQPNNRTEERLSPTATAKDAVKQNVAATMTARAPVVSDPNSPIGEWITEGGEGRVRITACGQALCGVVAGGNPNDTDRHNPDPAKRNRPMDGMTVLIDMKPAKNNHWEGQIYNAKDGRTYASNISLKNADVLRVEGCVFGGLFCGGQNWTRAKDARQG